MAVAVTNTTTILNTAVAITANAATSTTINEAEVFTITPNKADYKTSVIIKNVAVNQGSITYSCAAADSMHAGKAQTGTVAQGTEAVVQFEGAFVMQDAGTYLLTLTPATGKKLLTDHAAVVTVIGNL